MSDWSRKTKEVPFESLRPEMVTAISNHIQQYHLGPVLSDTLMCVETESEKVRRGLFGSAEIASMGTVVTPRWLIWVISGRKTGIAVLSAKLRDIVVRDYAQTQFAKMIPDTGIEVSGRFTDTSENISAFIGVEENQAGRKFIEVVLQAVQNAQ